MVDRDYRTSQLAWSESNFSHRSKSPQMQRQTLHEVVERERSGATAQQHQQHRRPLDMRRPGLRINEYLDDGGHTEQNQGGKPRQQSENEQNRRRDLDSERKI